MSKVEILPNTPIDVELLLHSLLDQCHDFESMVVGIKHKDGSISIASTDNCPPAEMHFISAFIQNEAIAKTSIEETTEDECI
jgi:hypothetical protein